MHVKNISGGDRSIVDPLGGADIPCPAGETVEVTDEHGASLCEQVDVWAEVKPRSKKAGDAGEED